VLAGKAGRVVRIEDLEAVLDRPREAECPAHGKILQARAFGGRDVGVKETVEHVARRFDQIVAGKMECRNVRAQLRAFRREQRRYAIAVDPAPAEKEARRQVRTRREVVDHKPPDAGRGEQRRHQAGARGEIDHGKFRPFAHRHDPRVGVHDFRHPVRDRAVERQHRATQGFKSGHRSIRCG
jgi:hypothetical protein